MSSSILALAMARDDVAQGRESMLSAVHAQLVEVLCSGHTSYEEMAGAKEPALVADANAAQRAHEQR